MKKIYVFQKNTKYLDGHRVKVNNRTCTICGSGFAYDKRVHWLIYRDNNACFDCQFWYDKWLSRDDPAVLRINGQHYTLMEHSALSAQIMRNDGTQIITDNLWHQGAIPAVWQGLGLENNARFIR